MKKVSKERLTEIMKYCQEKQMELGISSNVSLSVSTYPGFFVISVYLWSKDILDENPAIIESITRPFDPSIEHETAEERFEEFKNFLAEHSDLSL